MSDCQDIVGWEEYIFHVNIIFIPQCLLLEKNNAKTFHKMEFQSFVFSIPCVCVKQKAYVPAFHLIAPSVRVNKSRKL